MSNLKQFFSSQSEKLNSTIKRFYLPFGLTIALFLVFACRTLLDFNKDLLNIFPKIVCLLGFGIVTCILAKILYERYFRGKCSKFVLEGAALVLSAIPFALLLIYGYNPLLLLGLGGILISQIILIFYFSRTDSMSETFSYLFKSILFNLFACAIIFGGLSICILAFTSLIYNFKDAYKAHLILGQFVGTVLFGTMFLSGIPKAGQKITIPKVFVVIVSKIMLPVYVLLLSILYVYLGKIFFTWTFPAGWVNLFVSFSSLLFVFFAFSLSRYKKENKVIRLFLKFGGLAIIPTIAMQFVAIYIRISNYGLTSLRYASIALNIFALIFAIVFSLRPKKSLKNTPLMLAALVLLITVTPLNAVDIPMREQAGRLKRLLLNNNMLADNKITPNGGIALEEKNKIIDSFRYVSSNFKVSNYKPEFLNEELMNKPEKEIFGFERPYSYSSYEHSRINFNYDYERLNVAEYSKVHMDYTFSVEGDEAVLARRDEKETVEGLYDYLKALHSRYNELGKETVTDEKIEYDFGNKKLIVPRISMYYDDKQEFKISPYGSFYILE